ncbi:hypothetical protein OKW30_006088 [Paraburkholderia sp. Clong3]
MKKAELKFKDQIGCAAGKSRRLRREERAGTRYCSRYHATQGPACGRRCLAWAHGRTLAPRSKLHMVPATTTRRRMMVKNRKRDRALTLSSGCPGCLRAAQRTLLGVEFLLFFLLLPPSATLRSGASLPQLFERRFRTGVHIGKNLPGGGPGCGMRWPLDHYITIRWMGWSVSLARYLGGVAGRQEFPRVELHHRFVVLLPRPLRERR